LNIPFEHVAQQCTQECDGDNAASGCAAGRHRFPPEQSSGNKPELTVAGVCQKLRKGPFGGCVCQPGDLLRELASRAVYRSSHEMARSLICPAAAAPAGRFLAGGFIDIHPQLRMPCQDRFAFQV
jgi:hypothetical protein